MSDAELKLFREATQSPPQGARERVWRKVQHEVRPRRPVKTVVALAFVAAALAAVVFTRGMEWKKPSQSLQWSDATSAVVWKDAVAQRDEHRVVLSQGAVLVSSWGRPFEIQAHGHRVIVENGVVLVKILGENVTADALEGSMLFDSVSQKARPGITSALTATLDSIEQPQAKSQRLAYRLQHSIAEHRSAKAVDVLQNVAGSASLEAEVANFRQAEFQLRQLNLPLEALATLKAGEARFPSGSLSQERQLSAIEIYVKTGQWAEVEARTSRFLLNHASSERKSEIQILHASALGVLGKLQRACEELKELPKADTAELRNRFNCP